jgi:hypothetical protein
VRSRQRLPVMLSTTPRIGGEMAIVDRLINHANEPYHPDEDGALATEAAYEIVQLLTALRRIASLEAKNVPKFAQEIAMVALKESEARNRLVRHEPN